MTQWALAFVIAALIVAKLCRMLWFVLESGLVEEHCAFYIFSSSTKLTISAASLNPICLRIRSVGREQAVFSGCSYTIDHMSVYTMKAIQSNTFSKTSGSGQGQNISDPIYTCI